MIYHALAVINTIKNLNLAGRIAGQQLTQPIINPLTGELMAEAGEVVSFEKAQEIDNAGVTVAFVACRMKKKQKSFPTVWLTFRIL